MSSSIALPVSDRNGSPDDVQPRLHRYLAEFNSRRLVPNYVDENWERELCGEMEARLLEGKVLEEARSEIASQAAEAPVEVTGFMRWFDALKDSGPGQNDPLFDWLASDATLGEMRWFLRQEAAGEAGFDDLIAMTQVRFDVPAKLEMARNYWDEMGRGHERGMHGPMLAATVAHLDLQPDIKSTVWESLALANLMVGLAANRRYAFHAVGALGVIEMTAPSRVSRVNEGLKRLGVSTQGRLYFQLHAGLDIAHSLTWNREVIAPLVAADARAASAIAEGALMRLRSGERCFERYRRHFGPLRSMKHPSSNETLRRPTEQKAALRMHHSHLARQ